MSLTFLPKELNIMSNPGQASGSCLCGSVHFTATNREKKVGACHCCMCRKWGGSAFMAADCGGEVDFEGSDKISVFDSSEWADRGFCKNCGSHLFYRLKHEQQYMIPVGLFDDDSGLVFDHQLFIDEKPCF
jgi:hypothetical protein